MLKQRIITALIIAPIAIACVFFLPLPGFSLFIGLMITIAAWEWANLADYSGYSRFVYSGFIALLLGLSWYTPPLLVLAPAIAWWSLAFVLVLNYPEMTKVWSHKITRSLIGVVMLVPGFVALIQLKQQVDSNFLILLLFFLIWGADIGAYFTGRAFGKSKLAPDVSPGKSWAGVWGGLATSLLISIGMALWIGKPDLFSGRGAAFVGLCLFVVVVSVLGDLTISMFKRYRGVKDSSQLLPGHGGLLDRIDSMLSAGPIFTFAILMFGWV